MIRSNCVSCKVDALHNRCQCGSRSHDTLKTFKYLKPLWVATQKFRFASFVVFFPRKISAMTAMISLFQDEVYKKWKTVKESGERNTEMHFCLCARSEDKLKLNVVRTRGAASNKLHFMLAGFSLPISISEISTGSSHFSLELSSTHSSPPSGPPATPRVSTLSLTNSSLNPNWPKAQPPVSSPEPLAALASPWTAWTPPLASNQWPHSFQGRPRRSQIHQ